MKQNEPTKFSGQALAITISGISAVLRSPAARFTSFGKTRDQTASMYKDEASPEDRIALTNAIDALLRTTADQYQKLEHETQSLLGEEMSLQYVVPAMTRPSASAKMANEAPSAGLIAMTHLLSRVTAALSPTVVPLAGRVEAGEIAMYEPYEREFHPAAARTSIGTFSGDWVRRRTDGVLGTPDILLDLEYAHGDPAPEVLVELTWVGPETITVSGGTTWTSTPVVSSGERIGFKFRSLTLSPIGRWIKLPMMIAAAGTAPVQYDVWMRTAVSSTNGSPDDKDEDLIVRLPPTPLPLPVPSPTPTGIPTDIFAALDPDRWRQFEDRLGQFVRDTVGAFEGVLSRVDFLKDRTVLRDVSAALRERVRG